MWTTGFVLIKMGPVGVSAPLFFLKKRWIAGLLVEKIPSAPELPELALYCRYSKTVF
jgi:hypothetical protein